MSQLQLQPANSILDIPDGPTAKIGQAALTIIDRFV